MELVGCTGTLVNNYQSTLCNIPQEVRFQDNGRIAMCMENNDLQTCHKLRKSISYKHFPVLVFFGVNDNSNLKIIFSGTIIRGTITIIPTKIALQLLCQRFVKKTQ
jgi:hypothetical protein